MRYVVERASTKYIDKRKPCDEAIPADMIQDSALRILKTEGIENLPEECRYEHNWYIEINTLEELMEFTKNIAMRLLSIHMIMNLTNMDAVYTALDCVKILTIRFILMGKSLFMMDGLNNGKFLYDRTGLFIGL